jgi:aspartyl/asparaginyl-tRNA synthetase
MSQATGFNALQVGQMVQVKGKFEGGKLLAHEISMEDPDDDISIEGPVQSIDHEKSALFILDREIRVPGNVVVKDRQRNNADLKSVKAGDIIKLKGKYSAANGFVPEKIKIQEIMSSQLRELQGIINKIDQQNKTFDLLGFTVQVTEKTIVEKS